MTDTFNEKETKDHQEDEPKEIEEITDGEDKQPMWYVVHTYTGYENRVKDKIQMMIDNEQNPDIVDVTVPIEEYVEAKNDSKKIKTRKLFPGYVMVKMNITNRSWYIIRNTQGVTGFVGPDSKPVPLTKQEVLKFGIKEQKPIVNINVSVGDRVKIIAGPFVDFIADVKEIDKEKQTVKALIDMFGRDTIIDLSFTDIERI